MKSRFIRSFWGVLLVTLGVLASSYLVGTRQIRAELNEALSRAEAARAKWDISQISTMLNLYHRDHGAYPTSSEGLQAMPDFLETRDPWGRPYVYRSPGRSADYEVYTLGADRKEGGSGRDADIGSWAL